MNCQCGGMTRDHDVVRDKKVVGSYAKCVTCGRIHWWKRPSAELLMKRDSDQKERSE